MTFCGLIKLLLLVSFETGLSGPLNSFLNGEPNAYTVPGLGVGSSCKSLFDFKTGNFLEITYKKEQML